MTALLSVELLGSVRASIGEREIELGSPTQKAVFAVLAANGNRVVSRGELVQAVWGKSASETAVNSVYTYVARLRKCLQVDGDRARSFEVLVSDSIGYMLRIPTHRVDTLHFGSMLADARKLRAERSTERAVGMLEDALALWRGTPYSGAVGAFADFERARLTEVRMLAIEDHVEMLLEMDRPADVIGELSELVHGNPVRGRPRLLLMRAHVAMGQHADAICEYHALREALAEQQGIEPGERLRSFYEHILSADRTHRGRSAEVSGAQPRVPAPRPPVLDQPSRVTRWFQGRTGELRALEEIVLEAESVGESPLLLLTGSPGVGKSALANRFATMMADRFPDGQVHIDLRMDAARGTEGALRQLCAVMGGRTPTEGEDLVALYHGLTAGRRQLLVLDNATSVEQVRPLLPAASSCLVLVTSRLGLSGLIARDGAQRFVVDALPAGSALELFAGIVGEDLVSRQRDEAEQLVADCEGLPLALRIAATLVKVAPFPDVAMSQLRRAEPATALRLPGDANSDLGAVFGWSYTALPEDAARVYRAFGLLQGVEADRDTLAALSGLRAAECGKALDVLVDANLVREVTSERFRMGRLLTSHARWLALAAKSRTGIAV